MTKLLRAGVRRYAINPLTWVAFAAALLGGAFFGYMTNWCFYVEDIYMAIPSFICAILISLSVGREFSDGVIRNKITAGHRKGIIYLSELLLALINCTVIVILFWGVFAAFNTALLSKMPVSVICKLFVGCWLLQVTFVALHVLISSLITSKATASIVNLVLILAVIFSAYWIDDRLSQPEYFYEYGYNEEADEWYATEEKTLNPDYVKGVTRDIYEVVLDVLPYGQTVEYVTVFDVYCMGSEEEPLSLTAEQKTALNTHPFYSLGFIVAISAVGWFFFRRKDMK